MYYTTFVKVYIIHTLAILSFRFAWCWYSEKNLHYWFWVII